MPAGNPAGMALVAIMWIAMMAAMMLPSALPALFIYAKVVQQRQAQARPIAPVWIFAAGYLLVWTLFGAVLALLQLYLQSLSLLSMDLSLLPLASAMVMVAAGIYQLTPPKDVCLENCRSPLDFITSNWREGRRGAFWMGVKHGIYCLGCCWLLMVLLFAAGIMNMLWVVGIAIFVFLEKNAIASKAFSRLAGLVLIAWGLLIALAA